MEKEKLNEFVSSVKDILVSFNTEGCTKATGSIPVALSEVFHVLIYGVSSNGKMDIRENSKKAKETTDPKIRKAIKLNGLPACIMHGIANGKTTDDNMICETGLASLDIDVSDNPHIFSSHDILDQKIQALAEWQHTFALWKTISGGLKLLVKIPKSYEDTGIAFKDFKLYMNALERDMKEEFEIITDPLCKNVSRKIIINHSDLFTGNKDALVYSKKLEGEECPEEFYEESGEWKEADAATFDKVMAHVEEIERKRVDITCTYSDWLYTSLALASAFKENGKVLFRRVSQFHSEYNEQKCDDHYDSVLKSNRGRVSIATFYHTCHKYNVVPVLTKSVIKKEKPISEKEPKGQSPFIPDDVYEILPPILKLSSTHFSHKRHRDMYFFSALCILSGCLPNVFGLYNQKMINPALYGFITAPFASGKNVMTWAMKLASKIHEKLKKEFEDEKKAYKEAKKNGEEDLGPPPFIKMKFIPANISSPGFAQILSNVKSGIIAETEGDTFTSTKKNEWGDYSYMLRGIFEREPVTLYRKTGGEYISLEDVTLAIVMSGTPSSTAMLFTSPEDGLYSRFIHYFFDENIPFIDPFMVKESLDSRFENYSKQILDKYNTLNGRTENLIFSFTEKQIEQFNVYYSDIVDNGEEYYGAYAGQILKRLASIHFKIAMTLTAIRNEFLNEHLVCSDEDFEISMSLATVFKAHSFTVLKRLPERTEKEETSVQKREFYELLPDEFSTEQALELSKTGTVKMSRRALFRQLEDLVCYQKIERIKKGFYRKLVK